MKQAKPARYSEKEVRALIDNYAEYRERKSTHGVGLVFLVLLADIDYALSLLQPKEYQAILLHGLLGHTIRDAEEALGISKSTLHRRYDSGIEWIVRILNEGVIV